jgi:N-dimethylarginine dimethylaminohydrolase
MSPKQSAQYYHRVLERILPKAKPVFEDEDMQERVWDRRWGVYNDVGAMKMVLLHRPGDELKVMSDDKYDPEIEALIDDHEQWYFRSDKGPDLAKMQAEHDGLVTVYREHGVDVQFVDCAPRNPNGMFLRDDGIVVKGGFIVCRMGPVGVPHGTGRRGEEAYVTRKVASLGMPILHTVHGAGLMEGGSFCLIDERHAAIGTSYRQNAEGVDQVHNVLKHQGIELIEVPLVGHSLHIDGCMVMISHKKALIDITRLPFWFIDKLHELDVEPVHLDPRDDHIAINCIALSPTKVLMNDRGKYTGDTLDKMGFGVIQIPYDECHKHGGSIHCSSLPLIREED